MNIFDAIVLGVVQGVTEFIPVSSSGHLILARDVLGMTLEGSLAFDAVLHFATALAVLVYFRRDVAHLLTRARAQEQKTLWGALILGTIPAVLVGYFFGEFIASTTRSTGVVVWMLLAGSVLFVIAELFGSQKEKLSLPKGVAIGIYQTFALVPGVSRAGATVSGGLLFGLKREAATRFAFLLGFPILVGVGLSKLLELSATSLTSSTIVSLSIGSVVAFFVGLAAIHFMIRFLRTHRLYVFALYRILLAMVVFLLL